MNCSVTTDCKGVSRCSLGKGFDDINEIHISEQGIRVIYSCLRSAYFSFEHEKVRYELLSGSMLYGVDDEQFPSLNLKGFDRETNKLKMSISFLCNPKFKKIVEQIITKE